jgi:hypothetical protein
VSSSVEWGGWAPSPTGCAGTPTPPREGPRWDHFTICSLRGSCARPHRVRSYPPSTHPTGRRRYVDIVTYLRYSCHASLNPRRVPPRPTATHPCGVERVGEFGPRLREVVPVTVARHTDRGVPAEPLTSSGRRPFAMSDAAQVRRRSWTRRPPGGRCPPLRSGSPSRTRSPRRSRRARRRPTSPLCK